MEIIINNLKKTYNKSIIFENLTLSIPNNQLTCIYGRSGCGKTTLLNIIGCIEPYNSGTITYDGSLLTRRRDKRLFLRNKVGFIFQDYGLIPNETVKNNILLLNKARNIDIIYDRIIDILFSLNLDKRVLNKKVYELSGGEQQRVTMAKLLIKDPDLYLADEPTASLDDDNKRIVLRFLKDRVNNGKTVIIVSHDRSIINNADTLIDLEEEKNKL